MSFDDSTAEANPEAAPGTEHQAAYKIAHRAMATHFELYSFGDPQHDVEHAAELAFEHIDYLEQRLSFFLPGSDIYELNETPTGTPVHMSHDAFQCLLMARYVYELTGGAFDPTAGAMLRGRKSWQHTDGPVPNSTAPDDPDARLIGFDAVALDMERRTATITREGVGVDLGGIGKGYAVDGALEVLKDWLAHPAMVIAGSSTMRPMGLPPDGPAWVMHIRDPRDEQTRLDRIGLTDGAISASANVDAGHILDPRTGRPEQSAIGAWAVATTATVSDALATASMLLTGAELQRCAEADRTIAAARFEPDESLSTYGQWDGWRGKLVGARDGVS